MNFIYERPASLPEAIALYSMHGGRYPILAGGTDLVVQWRSGATSPEGFIDVSALDELSIIGEKEDSIEIGALTTHAQIAASKIVAKHLPVLKIACKTIGAAQIQNRGTIGGNIMNASPAGDTLPVLAACDSELTVQGMKSVRTIPVIQFFTGYRKTSLAPDELLTHIKFPKMEKEEFAGFYKIGTRRAQAISKVVVCCRATIVHGGIKKIAIGIGSVAPTVVRAPGTEALLKGKAITKSLIDLARHSLEDEVHPIDDVRSTAAYRKFVCGSLIARFLEDATSKRRS